MKIQMKKILASIMIGAMLSSVLPSIGVAAADSTGQTVEKTQELNYLYINKSCVEEQESQDIVVSWGNEKTNITCMTLQIENEEGQIISLSGTQYDANTVLFHSVLEEGSYEVIGLEVVADGTTDVLMEDYGICAGFGVGEEYSGEKSEYQSMNSMGTDTDVEYAVANLKEKDLEESVEEIVSTLADVDSSGVATMSADELGVSTQSNDGELVVVLDPGHDSKHAGARGNGVSEEVATLQIAKYCKEELEAYKGVRVYLTRNDAACPYPDAANNIDDIRKRVEWAKDMGADVFISIHLNSAGASAKGAEVYYPSQSSEGKKLAQSIQNELVNLGLYDRKIKAEDAYAVVNTSMANGFPGLIIEHAFVSNSSDAANYLTTESGLKKLGVADATGIAEYYGLSKTSLPNSGWKTDAVGNRYYYERGQAVVGEKNIAGKWYCFDNRGVMITGWHKFPEKTVYYKPSGEMTYGEYNINDEWYHFSEYDGSMTTGWYDFPDKTVYYKPSGGMVHGEYNINDEWYHFSEYDGSMTTGWYDFPDKTVYYKPSGGMVHGEYNINDEWYHFSEYDGSMTTGWYNFSDKTVYYKPSGGMVHGEYNINDEWYHFSEYDGAMTTGWYNFSDKTVYYKPSGGMVHGEYNINDKWYHFSEYDGAMTTGWYDFPEKTVYYKSNGSMAYGQYQIGNDWYYFDTYDGSMKTNFQYNGNYFGADGKMVKKDTDDKGDSDDAEKELTPIMGKSTVTVEQMVRLYDTYAAVEYPTEIYEKGGASTIEELATIFLEEANAEGVRAEVAWAQAMLETGYLKFGGQVKAEQFNFAGLGATDGGIGGADFSVYGEEGVRMGVRAQIQHLKAYASEEPLHNECIDSRFDLVKPRGCAQYVEYLGQKENPSGKGWATGERYGYKILNIMERMNNSK